LTILLDEIRYLPTGLVELLTGINIPDLLKRVPPLKTSEKEKKSE
jgi:hypothetical protein